MNRNIKKVAAFVLAIVLLLSGFPSPLVTLAAPQAITLAVAYNALSNKYDISFPMMTEPAYTDVSFHNPDGTLTRLTDKEVFLNNKVTISTEFLPDHIYDISVDVYKNNGDPAPTYQGKVYYLAKMTFTGESFNEMAKMSDIEDKNPSLDPNVPGSAITVKSGDDPVMKLKWKVPTFYSTTQGRIVPLTVNDNTALNELADPLVPISKACFQISMTVGHGSTKILDFNTDYSGSNMVVSGTTVTVSGITNGQVTSTDGFVSVTLTKDQGIEPGTEYEFTNIGVIFENAISEQVPVRRTLLRTDSDNRFMVKNVDNAFSDVGYDLSSIFTPMQMELTKVDTDKVQVKFKRITNGVYPELYYQVQYASRIDDLYTQTNKWVKIPNSTLPTNEAYGSEIVTITLNGISHPEYYFRVVYFDSASNQPRSSSLCVDLRLLGVDTGKPPLPREIKADPVYIGRKVVTVPTTELSSGDVEIPASDLRISFVKPLAWQQIANWDAFKAQAYGPDDYTFHVVISTYLPDTDINSQIGTVGFSNKKDIYLPVKQKRVLVLDKKDFTEDPNDKTRLICTIPGDQLFYDHVANQSLSFENNEDPSEDGTSGDYPTFLVPNTTYYMQVFTSRLKDNVDINNDVWGDSNGLSADISSRLSYSSPVISFTTWPLTEMPVPMPNIQLGIDPKTNVDASTGNITLAGISVNYDRVLTDVEWQRYTSATAGRVLQYEVFISRDANSDASFRLVGTDPAPYPDQAERQQRGLVITNSGITMANGKLEPILPNTVYYIKARASLIVNGVIIGRSADTAVKAITTPKIDSGSLDNLNRDPRSPSEFSIATDSNGELQLSDAWVVLNWLHAEKDVTYEMMVTSNSITPQAVSADYATDPLNVGFLTAYNEFRNPVGDSKMLINVNNAALQSAVGLTVDANGRVLMPIRRDFLRPNRTYYFSLRAVRNRGMTDPQGHSIQTVSRWITIPVTTRMVKAPAFLEAVKDLEVGFNIQNTSPNATADGMEVYYKKTGTPDTQYVKLNRSQFSAVKQGTTFYFRLYNLEADQWYDIRVKNRLDNRWYDKSTATWTVSPGTPVQQKTRDPLKEIEIRWEGEDPYTYFLEARTDSDADYQKLAYNPMGFSDYGYDLPSGGRVMFYREKTNLYVQDGSPKYVYYARITGKPVLNSDGSLSDLPLKSNTTYYVKLWAFNLEDSLHIGPVSIRTDFSQSDYDKEQQQDSVIDMYNTEADGLTAKLYWLVDIKPGTSLRAIVKDDQVSGLLRVARDSTVTIDLSGEQTNTTYYEILIPYKTLESIQTYDSRLNFKLQGAEVTINRGSIDLTALKAQSLANGAKEAMVLLKIDKRTSPKTALPTGFTASSNAYTVQASMIGSRLAYSEINGMIYNILKKPDATGPFKYGILDRELSAVLKNLDSYSYKSHADLQDMIRTIIGNVESELSRYLKDIVDGGSGLPADFTVNKAITSFPGRIGVKIEYTYRNGLIMPYVNYASAPGWKEPLGAKAYVLQYVLFRAERPGEYVIAGRGSVIVQPGSPFDNAISKLSSRYDLSKVFGKGTLYPNNPVTGQQAVMLYAVLTKKDGQVTGMTPIQTTSKLGLGDIISAKQLMGYMDNQTSVSMAVRLYSAKANIAPTKMKPTRSFYIANSSQINSRLYPYVLLGLDLNLTGLSNRRFDAVGRTTTGVMLDMVSKVLEKFEK